MEYDVWALFRTSMATVKLYMDVASNKNQPYLSGQVIRSIYTRYTTKKKKGNGFVQIRKIYSTTVA